MAGQGTTGAILGRSAIEQAALVRAGDVSARELVEASLEAIERLNGDVNARSGSRICRC